MLNVRELDLQFVTDKQGQKTAVILDIEQFEELLEDIEDLALIAERRDEETVSHAELLAELKHDGIL